MNLLGNPTSWSDVVKQCIVPRRMQLQNSQRMRCFTFYSACNWSFGRTVFPDNRPSRNMGQTTKLSKSSKCTKIT